MESEKLSSADNLKINWNLAKGIYIGKDNSFGIYTYELANAIKLCTDAAKMLQAACENVGERQNTVIGVIGERGTGKTSFLYTLKNCVPSNVLALDVVDITDFQDKMGALELFLAAVYKSYIKLTKEYKSKIGAEQQAVMNKKFKNISKLLSSLREDQNMYHNENPSSEVLYRMQELSSFRDIIRSLCDSYIDLFNYVEDVKKSCIAILFDDVDLASNHDIWNLLQDIRKYLSGNVIVVLSFRERQLTESVVDHFLSIDKKLIDTGLMSIDEIQSKAADLIEKAIPSNAHIKLFDQEDILNRKIVEIAEPLCGPSGDAAKCFIDINANLDDSISTKTWITSMLYSKALLKIEPFNQNEITSYIWPKNIRELIPLLKLLHEDMAFVSKNFSVCNAKIYASNLQLFENYFLQQISRTFAPDVSEIFATWIHTADEFKNYLTYGIALDRILKKQSSKERNGEPLISKDLLNIKLVKPRNITVGDISHILNTLISASYDDALERFFGYSFKILYSIRLLSLIYESFSTDDKNTSINKYTKLLNTCVFTPEDESSILSRTIKYKKAQLPNINIGNEYIDKNTDAPNIQARVFYMLCPSNISITGDIFMNSRLFTNNAISARPAYKSILNRELFTLNEYIYSDSEINDSKHLWTENYTYGFNLLNFLGKNLYINNALDLIKSKDSNGAYLFYSLFDLDVISEMQLERKESSEEILTNQMKRLNTAFWMATKNVKANIDSSIRSALRNSSTLLLPNLKNEIESYSYLCVPFINNTDSSFRLFYSATEIQNIKYLNPLSITFEEIEEADSQPYIPQQKIEEIVEFTTSMEKGRLRSYLKVFTDSLVHTSPFVRAEITAIDKHLSESGTRLRIDDKRKLREIIRDNPEAAYGAYSQLFSTKG